MHATPKFSPTATATASALIPREPEAKVINSSHSPSEILFSSKWVLSRPGSRTYKGDLSKIGAELKRIDMEREKDATTTKEKTKRISFANGIKSFCIYVPRKLHFKFM